MRKNIRIIIAVLLCMTFAACGKNAQNYIDEGMAFMTEENYEEAVIAFTSAIEIEGKNVEAYRGRAQAYTAMSQYENAVNDYQAMLEIDPDDQDAYDNIIDAYLKQGDEETAVAYIERKEDTFGSNSVTRNQKTIKDRNESIAKLEDIIVSGNREEFYELLDSDEFFSSITANSDFIAMLKESPMIRQVGNKYLGLYVESDTDFIWYYYGEMANNIRHGNGVFKCICYSAYGLQYEEYTGNWVNDIPQGNYAYVNYSYVDNEEILVEGNIVDGFWDGEVIETCDHRYVEVYDNGILQNAYHGVDQYGNPIDLFCFVSDTGQYYATDDDFSGTTFGVRCFADSSYYFA